MFVFPGNIDSLVNGLSGAIQNFSLLSYNNDYTALPASPFGYDVDLFSSVGILCYL